MLRAFKSALQTVVPLCLSVGLCVANGAPTLVKPWKTIALDPDYSGAWVVAGDLTGDGTVEIVSARNVDANDVHYTSAVVAQRMDGSVLWRWGNPAVGRRELHHDVPCQIHDWDGDGRNEVVLCTRGFLVELDGATGVEKRRFSLPEDATDCLVFANLSGGPRPPEVLVKTRYTRIWAFDYHGHPLWSVNHPGGYRTAHQPVPVDLDGDGRQEIMAGYARHHALLDWTGDGVDEIVIAQPRALYDGAGQVLAVLDMDATDDLQGEERLVLSGDFSGDGVPDILLTTRAISHVHIYRNERGRRPNPPAPLGTGLNVTLY